MDAGQQAARIIFQLRGPARQLVRAMSWTDVTQGGQIAGRNVDAITFLLTHLAAAYAPLGEEARAAGDW